MENYSCGAGNLFYPPAAPFCAMGNTNSARSFNADTTLAAVKQLLPHQDNAFFIHKQSYFTGSDLTNPQIIRVAADENFCRGRAISRLQE